MGKNRIIMENRIIKIEELEIGDEVLIPISSGKLAYAKIVRKPQLSKSQYTWLPNTIRWKAVRCMLRVKTEVILYGSNSQYSKTIISHPFDDTLPLMEKNIDFNFKHIWLIKREGQ